MERPYCEYCDKLLSEGYVDLPLSYSIGDDGYEELGKTGAFEIIPNTDDGGNLIAQVSGGFIIDENACIVAAFDIERCPYCGRDLVDFLETNYDDMKKRGVIA